MGVRFGMLHGHNCCGEVLVWWGWAIRMTAFVKAYIRECRAGECAMYALWLYDATKDSCDLSTSYHEDIAWVGCESKGTWLYRTTLIFLWGDLCRFVWVGYLWFLGWWNSPNFACDLGFFFLWDLMCEKGIAWKDWNGYFWDMEKSGLNSLSVFW